LSPQDTHIFQQAKGGLSLLAKKGLRRLSENPDSEKIELKFLKTIERERVKSPPP
jgi:hypothetical protein